MILYTIENNSNNFTYYDSLGYYLEVKYTFNYLQNVSIDYTVTDVLAQHFIRLES